MGEENAALDLARQPPAVILHGRPAGLGQDHHQRQAGAGCCASRRRRCCSCAATSTARPRSSSCAPSRAQVGVDFFPSTAGEEPVDIARRALDYARTHYLRRADRRHRRPPGDRRGDDAGDRRAARRAARRSKPCSWSTRCRARTRSTSPRRSASALPLTGVILTKLDGDARGGAALSVRQVTGKPIKFVGVGEKLAALERSIPSAWRRASSAWATSLSLVEEAQQERRRRGGAEARREGQEGQGLRPGGLQAADRADAQDGRARRR